MSGDKEGDWSDMGLRGGVPVLGLLPSLPASGPGEGVSGACGCSRQAAEQLLALSHPTDSSQEGWPGIVARMYPAWQRPGLPCFYTPQPA